MTLFFLFSFLFSQFILAQQVYGKFAYVTVHYEGTSRDAEYVLGIQVMMQSLKLTHTKADLIVLASNTVSSESIALFESMGLRVIPVDNIANPFVDSTLVNKNFIFTLNKLHVWNLVEYEKVVYLDADNLVLRNADELFMCGSFCAVFMNPCHFHTGLLVIEPNAREYKRLLSELSRLGSFDGADQGFLSSVYSDSLRESDLFKHQSPPSKEASTWPHVMRLSIGYNINHKYYYEQYHWKLFYLRHFANMTLNIESSPHVIVESARAIPALTIGFPIATTLKPWYWWSVMVLDLHWVWHDVRDTLEVTQEHFGLQVLHTSLLWTLLNLVLGMIVCVFLPCVVAAPFIKRVVCHTILSSDSVGLISRTCLILMTVWLASRPIHSLCVAKYAIAFFITTQHLYLAVLACILCSFSIHGTFQRSTLTSLPANFYQTLLLSCSVSFFTLFNTYLEFVAISNVVWKLIFTVLLLLLTFFLQHHVLLTVGVNRPRNKS